jgi:hypothetical protein
MTHPSISSLVLLLTILVFESLSMHAGLIYVLIIPTNCSSVPLVAFFLRYSNMHKGFKCLDVAADHIYVSCDVIFDKTMFHFASMHSNDGVRYHSTVLLEPIGNSAINNLDYASTMTLLHVVNLDVQVPIGSSSPSVSAASFPTAVLTDVSCAPGSHVRAYLLLLTQVHQPQCLMPCA